MDNASKIQLLIQMREIAELLSLRTSLNEQEQNILKVCEATFSSLDGYLELFNKVTAKQVASQAAPPVQPSPSHNSQKVSPAGVEEGMAMVTGMAIAGLLPVHLPPAHHVDPGLEDTQIQEFHSMLADLDLNS